MKSKKKIDTLVKVVLVVVMSMSFLTLQAQKKHKTYLRLNYLKNTDDKKILTVVLKTRINKTFYELADRDIKFSITGDSVINLGVVKTDKKGKAVLEVKEELGEGLVTFKARFAGNDTLKSKSSSVDVKDLTMNMKLEIVDSVKVITVTTESETNPETEKDLYEGVEIQFSVKRMFTQLPIATKSIEDGSCSIEFPNDLPGDSIGNLSIHARIVDHDEFANVEKVAVIDWGTPVSLVTEEFNPFVASGYIKFMFIAFGVIFVVVYIVSKTMKKRANS